MDWYNPSNRRKKVTYVRPSVVVIAIQWQPRIDDGAPLVLRRKHRKKGHQFSHVHVQHWPW